MKIEDVMKEIDSIINQLKDDTIEIDKSIELYNRGVELTNKSLKELEDKKLKIMDIRGNDVEL